MIQAMTLILSTLKYLSLTIYYFPFPDNTFQTPQTMDLIATKENYNKISSSDSEDGRRSASMFEIEIERSKDLTTISEESVAAVENVFIRRPAMNQVNIFCQSYTYNKFVLRIPGARAMPISIPVFNISTKTMHDNDVIFLMHEAKNCDNKIFFVVLQKCDIIQFPLLLFD